MKHLVHTVLFTGAVTAVLLVFGQERAITQASGSISAPRNVPGIDKPVRIVRGRFTGNVNFTNDAYWVLRGAVFIGAPAHLNIQPGTSVIGETATRGTLIIERGAQIIADGTAAQPIVMTSDQPVGQRGRGDWGGLVLNGRAPINITGGEAIGEGSTGVYGGTDENDSSGVLRYVRVEYAGIEFSPDNELNGIAFQGVGRGTIVENIQIHFNKDDGIEMFGGTVDIKRVVLTNIGDDSIDWTGGWRGRLQFAVCQQRGDDTDMGIEADNSGSNNDLQPRSAPTLFNITLVGDPGTEFGPESANGAILRVGTGAQIRNFIIMSFKRAGFEVRDAATFALIPGGVLSVTHGILFGNGSLFTPPTAPLITAANGTIFSVNPVLVDPFNRTAPDWRPAPNSPALELIPAVPPADGFFEAALYMGALRAELENDWTRGWTNYAQR